MDEVDQILHLRTYQAETFGSYKDVRWKSVLGLNNSVPPPASWVFCGAGSLSLKKKNLRKVVVVWFIQ